MTDNDIDMTGEERHRTRRRNYWRYVIIAMLAFLGAGFFSGIIQAAYREGDVGLWVPLAAFALIIPALIWFTWDYFRRIDELDLMDNLWAHLIGQYCALIGFIVWYLLADLDLIASYPSGLAVIAVMIVTTCLAYGARKLGWR